MKQALTQMAFNFSTEADAAIPVQDAVNHLHAVPAPAIKPQNGMVLPPAANDLAGQDDFPGANHPAGIPSDEPREQVVVEEARKAGLGIRVKQLKRAVPADPAVAAVADFAPVTDVARVAAVPDVAPVPGVAVASAVPAVTSVPAVNAITAAATVPDAAAVPATAAVPGVAVASAVPAVTSVPAVNAITAAAAVPDAAAVPNAAALPATAAVPVAAAVTASHRNDQEKTDNIVPPVQEMKIVPPLSAPAAIPTAISTPAEEKSETATSDITLQEPAKPSVSVRMFTLWGEEVAIPLVPPVKPGAEISFTKEASVRTETAAMFRQLTAFPDEMMEAGFNSTPEARQLGLMPEEPILPEEPVLPQEQMLPNKPVLPQKEVLPTVPVLPQEQILAPEEPVLLAQPALSQEEPALSLEKPVLSQQKSALSLGKPGLSQEKPVLSQGGVLPLQPSVAQEEMLPQAQGLPLEETFEAKQEIAQKTAFRAAETGPLSGPKFEQLGLQEKLARLRAAQLNAEPEEWTDSVATSGILSEPATESESKSELEPDEPVHYTAPEQETVMDGEEEDPARIAEPGSSDQPAITEQVSLPEIVEEVKVAAMEERRETPEAVIHAEASVYSETEAHAERATTAAVELPAAAGMAMSAEIIPPSTSEAEATALPKSKRGRKSLKEVAAEADLIDIPSDEVLFSKQYYSMGEVSEMFRVNQSLLRFWESEFSILQPKKNKKGDRHFRPTDIKNLHLIYHLLRQRKYTIEGAKEFLKKNKKADQRFEAIQRLQQIRAFLFELKAQL